MSDERKQILQMVAQGKITIDEADRLLTALDGEKPADGNKMTDNSLEQLEPVDLKELLKHKESLDTNATQNPKQNVQPKYLHVKVQSEPGSGRKHENVDIKIPLLLLKAGVKLSSIVPDKAKSKLSAHLSEKGIDLDLQKLKSDDLDVLIQALSESSINVDSDHEKVRIFCA